MCSYILRITSIVALSLICVQLVAAQSQVQPSLDHGRTLLQEGRSAEAEAVFQQAVDQDGRSAPARYWLGMACYAQKKDDRALDHFQRAVQLDKKWADGYLGMGMVFLRMKNRRLDARAALRTAAKLNPEDAQIQYFMGLSYMNQERTGRLLSAEDGRSYFQAALELNPAHPDAQYQLGRCYETATPPEYDRALVAYAGQLWVRPDHREAFLRFTNLCMRKEQYQGGANLFTQMMATYGDGVPSYIRSAHEQFTALSALSENEYEQAQQAFEMYLTHVDEQERALYTDLTYVASPEEIEAYNRASGPEKNVFWQTFWASRDPNPATVINERLVEHYRRVMYARTHFAASTYPWDRRGEIYVRYGEPDDRRRFLYAGDDPYESFQSSGKPEVDIIREMNLKLGYQLRVDRGQVTTLLNIDVAKRMGFGAESIRTEGKWDGIELARREITNAYTVESWVYVPFKLELFFVDQMGGGAFDYPMLSLIIDDERASSPNPGGEGFKAAAEMSRQVAHHPERLAAELIKRTPSDYRHDFGGEPLEFVFDAVTFRGPGGDTEVEMLFSLPLRQLGNTEDGEGLQTWLKNRTALRDERSRPVVATDELFGPIDRPQPDPPKKSAGTPAYTTAMSFQAPAGNYSAAVELQDQITTKVGVYKKPVSIPDYHGDDLLVSDLKLAVHIAPAAGPGMFVRRGLQVEPNVSRLFRRGQPVYVYYEMYNLDQNASGATAFETHFEITPRGDTSWWERPAEQRSVLVTYEGAGSSSEEARFTSLDTGNLDAGEYVLTFTLIDQHTGQRVSKTASFLVVGTGN